MVENEKAQDSKVKSILAPIRLWLDKTFAKIKETRAWNKISSRWASFTKKYKFSNSWKALVVLLILLIGYTLYHVSSGLVETVKTTPAGLVEQKSSVLFEGVIFREEECISTSNKGDMRPYYYDGERVSVDSIVAAVYDRTSNSDTNEKIAELEEKLDILRKSNVSGLVSIVDIEGVRSDIDKLYTSMMLAISDGDSLRAVRAENQLIIAMNKLKIYQGEVKNYNEEIARIESELDSLYKSFKGNAEYISADKGGYFYHSCDGYEEILTEDALSSLTADALKELISDVKKKPIIKSDYKCKFVYDNMWRVATLCGSEALESLEEGKTYKVVLFDVRERELSFTLDSIGKIEDGQAVLVFSCLDMPEDFDFLRYQSFRLDISSIEGYRVPKEALVTKKVNGEVVNGVYVLDSGFVVFKRTEIIGEADGYYLSAMIDRTREDYLDYLDLNDIIILETSGMYEGKKMTR